MDKDREREALMKALKKKNAKWVYGGAVGGLLAAGGGGGSGC